MNKILILLLIVGYGVAGTEDYNYKWQSNKRLKKMLEQDKAKMARLFDENRALEDKAFWSVIDE